MKLFRIAPTPSGFLHKGNIFNFLMIQRLARDHAADILLRIDDLDSDRVRESYIENIFETLKQQHIQYQSGPLDIDDFQLNWSQHQRLGLYNRYLDQLKLNNRVFACECSRKQLEGHAVYPGTCANKGLPLTDLYNWRLKTDSVTIRFHDHVLGEVNKNIRDIGDFVVRRRGGLPAYQLASVADDIYFGVTHIVRGEDLLDSTFMQLWLAQCIGDSHFRSIEFWHHGLIKENGVKLSKSVR